ncbi:MAG: glycosyl hydrolase 108 family protein [Methylocella sp.]
MTAENFPACLAFTLKYEGGRSDDPRDPGGRTMEGVTQATYDRYRNFYNLPKEDVFSIKPAMRDEIYRGEYWDLVNGDALRRGEDLCVFDLAVNSGVSRANRLSGVWKTHPIRDAIEGICAHRLSFLHALQTWSHFGAGWGRRVAGCEALALRMSHGEAASAILSSKAKEAAHHSGRKATQAVVAGTITGSAAIAHASHVGMSAASGIAIIGVVMTLTGILVFHAWRQSQRAAAFAVEAKR